MLANSGSNIDAAWLLLDFKLTDGTLSRLLFLLFFLPPPLSLPLGRDLVVCFCLRYADEGKSTHRARRTFLDFLLDFLLGMGREDPFATTSKFSGSSQQSDAESLLLRKPI